MATFLVYLPLPSPDLAEPILKAAASFLEAHGEVQRTDLGSFERAGRKKDIVEHLKLVRFAAACDGPEARTRARALEGVLRATLASAGIYAGEARVFVEAAGAAA